MSIQQGYEKLLRLQEEIMIPFMQISITLSPKFYDEEHQFEQLKECISLLGSDSRIRQNCLEMAARQLIENQLKNPIFADMLIRSWTTRFVAFVEKSTLLPKNGIEIKPLIKKKEATTATIKKPRKKTAKQLKLTPVTKGPGKRITFAKMDTVRTLPAIDESPSDTNEEQENLELLKTSTETAPTNSAIELEFQKLLDQNLHFFLDEEAVDLS